MSVRKGDRAPVFQLPAKPGEVIDLGNYIGKERVVLLFFPLAYSSVCTDEFCHMRDTWDEWKNIGAHVFGISVDSPFVAAKFKEELNLPFPLLSDFNKDVAKQYGALHEELKGLKGIAKRSAFVIDETGKVVYAWVSEEPGNMVPFDEVKRALEAVNV